VRRLLAGIIATVAVAGFGLAAATVEADHEYTRWPSRDGAPPVVTVIPWNIDNPALLGAVEEATRVWNDTGVVRLYIEPARTFDPAVVWSSEDCPQSPPANTVYLCDYPITAGGLTETVTSLYQGQWFIATNRLWVHDAAATGILHIALHELGHALGLNHTTDPGSIMSGFDPAKLCPNAHDLSHLQPQADGISVAPGSGPAYVPSAEAVYLTGALASGLDADTIDVRIVGSDVNTTELDHLVAKAESLIGRKIRYTLAKVHEEPRTPNLRLL
jgi:hypothetical protein